MNKAFIFLATLAIVIGGCKSSTNPVVQALNTAGCDVESAMTTAFASAVVVACKGTGTAEACGSAFQTSLGNVNLCATPVPSSMKVASLTANWKTIGDIPGSALKKGAVKADALAPMGVIGGLICPLGINTVMGYMTAQIPLACGCTVSLTASELDSDLVAACTAAIPL